ncbi:SDR family oxidoreductase [Streptomyces eurythermus]|uniref:SDR family oxidoreductase n=1 Tax=Streptomyces eurythermus TaxID=42237 RepID=UPI0033D68AED
MSTQGQNTAPILVIGATGKTGRRVVERLQGLGRPARSGSRSSEIPFVWEDESTWEAALDGVLAAYVTYYPDLAFPGAKEAVERFAAFAVERGVRRLVLPSRRDLPAHQDVEGVSRSGPRGEAGPDRGGPGSLP